MGIQYGHLAAEMACLELSIITSRSRYFMANEYVTSGGRKDKQKIEVFASQEFHNEEFTVS